MKIYGTHIFSPTLQIMSIRTKKTILIKTNPKYFWRKNVQYPNRSELGQTWSQASDTYLPCVGFADSFEASFFIKLNIW